MRVDTLFVGIPEPVAVRDGRIVAVGESAAGLMADTVVDCSGGVLLPAFRDGHAHPIFAAAQTLFAEVASATSVHGVQSAVKEWAEAHPDEPWIRGDGYDPALAPDGNFDARWLDEVVPDRPVYLRASDYHTVWVNSEALRLAGISAQTPEPVDGCIERRSDGSPLGTLREWGAWGLVAAHLPALHQDHLVSLAAHASQHLAAHGISWVQDAWADDDVVAAWSAGVDAGVVDVRVGLALLVTPTGWSTEIPEHVERRGQIEAAYSPTITARTVKFFADGVIEGATGAVSEPYHCECPHPYGMPNWEQEQLNLAVESAVAQGFQPHIHAIGDAGVSLALNALEYAQETQGHHGGAVLAHCQLVSAHDIERMARLGVAANVQPIWAQLDSCQTELTIPRLGRERADRQYPFATMIDAGVPLAGGSDWPVSSVNPLSAMATAMSRQTPDGDPEGGWVPRERLTLDHAIDAYTVAVARQAGESHERGAIAVGQWADLVLIDRPVHSAGDLHAASVLGTWVEGRRIVGSSGGTQ